MNFVSNVTMDYNIWANELKEKEGRKEKRGRGGGTWVGKSKEKEWAICTGIKQDRRSEKYVQEKSRMEANRGSNSPLFTQKGNYARKIESPLEVLSSTPLFTATVVSQQD
jgi:hypothetical protein